MHRWAAPRGGLPSAGAASAPGTSPLHRPRTSSQLWGRGSPLLPTWESTFLKETLKSRAFEATTTNPCILCHLSLPVPIIASLFIKERQSSKSRLKIHPLSGTSRLTGTVTNTEHVWFLETNTNHEHREHPCSNCLQGVPRPGSCCSRNTASWGHSVPDILDTAGTPVLCKASPGWL